MVNLKGKKLLVMGGINLACDIVTKAKEMGVYVIVTDYLEDSPAKKIADKSFLVSTTDVEALVELCKKEKVDGVFTNYIDSMLPYAQKVCERLGMPFLATQEQLELIVNKQKAKNLCKLHGIPVPKQFRLTSEFLRSDLDNIKYPVLTKPVDNSGQRGIVICHNEKELLKGFSESMNYSKSKNVIVEEYLEGDYVVINFTLQNGYLSLSALADKPVISKEYSNGLVRLPKGYVLPSKYIDLFYETLYEKFTKLSKAIGLQNGSVGVEAIVKDGIFYVFEMQYRLGGIQHHNFVKQENGIDIMGMHIRYALTGRFEGWDLRKLDNPRFSNTYCLLNLLVKPGIISEIKGIDKVLSMPEVINFLPMHKKGDVIEQTGTVMQIFAKLSIAVESKESLLSVLRKINTELKVLDENGEQMLLESITMEELYN